MFVSAADWEGRTEYVLFFLLNLGHSVDIFLKTTGFYPKTVEEYPPKNWLKSIHSRYLSPSNSKLFRLIVNYI
jgi:hypothetical protein